MSFLVTRCGACHNWCTQRDPAPTEKETAQTILKAMGLPDEPPPLARARSPDLVDDLAPDW